ncbi:hypothetical protein BDV26DRAFT_274365 [Aspergillus bertholletiae]|uniref:Uncharacterized protein n=1 Tax=Aspergillus bertholletiae TaxID=1226010 RepID=A0A5N7AR40_9EURO|nr:hypothetical protein BDV26DRAFT_274365 [Aspergillus bertholletiae]
MDKLVSKLSGGSSSSNDSKEGSSSSSDKDYVDKGLDTIEKKFGGGRINPDDPKVRAANEKFTDAARNQVESMTGKKVPSKFSN